ncbi:CAP domain-containing protein [Halobiforma nitratireducens]|uniref:SCP-like extracellular n=1 Tax=Halobiforma nitratireducens JCM 10879 TaxID=1227454 RepID=M0MQS7_9EURY|nr:CAP domain-containing protein [Halobiforma nitratireducens]EMA47094.1 SCP-like extracellular [Halobiforma nitratireducens JCM 10879]
MASPGRDQEQTRKRERASAADETSRTRAAAAPGPRNRALLRSLFTLGFVLLLVGTVVLGGLLVGPTVLETIDDLESADEIEVVDGPSPSAEPPPAGERDVDETDPDDPGESSYETDVETISSEAVEDFVHAEVNDRRAEHDLEPIEWDGTIASVARAHSYDMADRNYFAHTNPDGEGPYDRFTDVDDYCRAYGENIALTWVDRPVDEPGNGDVVEYRTAEHVASGLVDQWMNSTEHREAILEEHASHGWDRGGVGIYVDDDGAVYASHNFCYTL